MEIGPKDMEKKPGCFSAGTTMKRPSFPTSWRAKAGRNADTIQNAMYEKAKVHRDAQYLRVHPVG